MEIERSDFTVCKSHRRLKNNVLEWITPFVRPDKRILFLFKQLEKPISWKYPVNPCTWTQLADYRWVFHTSSTLHSLLSAHPDLFARSRLPGLERNELDDYLTHRLRLAGCEIPLFEPPAVEALFQSARGLPRLVNRIAHYALSAAALDNARTVNPEHLQHAVEELRL